MSDKDVSPLGKRAKPILAELVLFIGLVAVLSAILIQKDYPLSQNALYHSRIASLYADGVFQLDQLGILQKSYFGEHFINQHAIYHWLLVPFVEVFGEIKGLKVANAFMLGLLVMSLSLVLRSFGVRWSGFWAVISLFSLTEGGFDRLIWERPEALTAACFLLPIWVLQTQRSWVWIFAISFLLAGFSYFALILPFLLAVWLAFAWRESRRFNFEPFLASCAGIGLGLVLSFYPLENIRYMVMLILENLNWLHGPDLRVSEWRGPRGVFDQYWLGLLALFGSSLYLLGGRLQIQRHQLFAAFGAFFLFILAVKIQRFEYLFHIFSILLAVPLVAMPLRNLPMKLRKRQWNWVIGVAVALLLTGLTSRNLYRLYHNFNGARPYDYDMSKFQDWLRQSPYADEAYINYRWDYWSHAFFHNPRTKGEPGYSLIIYKMANPLRLASFQGFRDEVKNRNLSDATKTNLVSEFGTRLLLISRKHSHEGNLRRDTANFTLLYEDETFSFYQINRKYGLSHEPLDLTDDIENLIADIAVTYLKDPTHPNLSWLRKQLRRRVNELPVETRKWIDSSILFTTLYDKESFRITGCVSNDQAAKTLYDKLITALDYTLKDRRFTQRSAQDRRKNYHHIKVALLYAEKHLASMQEYANSEDRWRFALRVADDNSRATYLAEVPLQEGWDASHLINRLLKKGDVKPPYHLSYFNQVSWVIRPDGRVWDSFNNYVPVFGPLLTKQQMTLSQKKAVEYLKEQVQDSGDFRYLFDPRTGRHKDKNSLVRKTQAAWTLCRAAYQENGNTEARNLCRKAMSYLETNVFGVVSNQEWHHKFSLGEISLWGLALLESQGHSWFTRAFEEDLSAVRKGVLRFFDKERGFFTLTGKSSRSMDFFYSGEALLFLASDSDREWHRYGKEILRRALPYYHELYRGMHQPFMIRWHFAAYSRAYRRDPQSDYLNYLQDMKNEVLTAELDPRNECIQNISGHFTQNKAASYVSGLLFEGLVEAWDQPKVLSVIDKKRLLGLLKCQMRRQLNSYNVGEFHNPKQALGGFPMAEDNMVIRIDIHSHQLSGLITYMEQEMP